MTNKIFKIVIDDKMNDCLFKLLLQQSVMFIMVSIEVMAKTMKELTKIGKIRYWDTDEDDKDIIKRADVSSC